MKKRSSALIKTVGVAAGLIGAASYLAFYEVMGRNAKLAPKLGTLFVGKSGLPAETEPDERRVWFETQNFEEFEMINEKMQRLRGYLLPAEKPSDVYVFCSHGYRNCGKGEFALIVKFYHDKGYNVFLVDHQASGESDGKYIGFGYHECPDCLRWLDFLLERFGSDIQIILHGISMGCATVTMMSGSGKLPDAVKFIVADCGYTSAYDEFMSNVGSMKNVIAPVMSLANKINKKVSGYEFK
ncbi:MAG: alpha/beta hydrolase, partial [Clostridia bacterium]|nr:alpha/beta hydrolase [Clostridia bacterium]